MNYRCIGTPRKPFFVLKEAFGIPESHFFRCEKPSGRPKVIFFVVRSLRDSRKPFFSL